MNIKYYEAPTMKAALALVKEELGPNAFILSTQRKVKKSLFGLSSKTVYEVRAAAELAGQGTGREGRGDLGTANRRGAQAPARSGQPAAKAAESAEADPFLDMLMEDYRELANYLPYSAASQQSSRPSAAASRPAAAASFRPSNIEPPGLARLRTPAQAAPARPAAKPAPVEAGDWEAEIKSLAQTINNIMTTSAPAPAATAAAPVAAPRPTTAVERDDSPEAERLRASLAAARRALSQPAPTALAPVATTNQATPTQAMQQKLEAAGLAADLAAKLLQPENTQAPDTRSRATIWQQARARLAALLKVTAADELLAGSTRAVALLGPTGVGKTTTVAKLAARAILHFQRKVMLITLDTYRIGAVKQLAIYADIIGIPIKVAKSAAELETIIAATPADTLLLIDTIGRSPFKLNELGELVGYLANATEIKKCLVTSATTSAADNHRLATKFAAFGYDRIIITKTDETENYGTMINLLAQSHQPLAYLTNGQNVPEDILAATSDQVVELLFKQVEGQGA